MENSPPGIQELLDMMDYDDAAEWQQICDDLREKLLRKKQKRDEMKFGGPGALGRCSPGTEDFPGREELMEMLDYDGAAKFLQIQATELRKKNRDEMNCGGPGAPGPVIANRPNPPRANKKIRVRKVQADAPDSAENQILQTDAPGWSEIRMGDGEDFDVTFRDGTIILSTPVNTDCAGAPRPSKMPKVVVDTQEKKKTPLRS